MAGLARVHLLVDTRSMHPARWLGVSGIAVTIAGCGQGGETTTDGLADAEPPAAERLTLTACARRAG